MAPTSASSDRRLATTGAAPAGRTAVAGSAAARRRTIARPSAIRRSGWSQEGACLERVREDAEDAAVAGHSPAPVGGGARARRARPGRVRSRGLGRRHVLVGARLGLAAASSRGLAQAAAVPDPPELAAVQVERSALAESSPAGTITIVARPSETKRPRRNAFALR